MSFLDIDAVSALFQDARGIKDPEKRFNTQGMILDVLRAEFSKFKTSIDSKDREISSLVQRIATLERQLFTADINLLDMESQLVSVTDMKRVLNVYIELIFKHGTLESNYRALADRLVNVAGGLNTIALGNMAKLEKDPPDQKIVVQYLQSLYYKLDGARPYQTRLFGFVCGGKKEMRVAVGLALAQAQRDLDANDDLGRADFHIHYCDDNGYASHTIYGGEIKEIGL